MALTTEQSEDLEPADQAGTVFGRYHVRRKIGEGAMARVFEAYDPATDRRIALKMLKPSLRSDETLVSRFMNEARAAGGLSHPHIVACYDVDITDDAPYITMELLEGPSLEELLAEGSSTNLALTVEHLCQIALALDHAHQAGRIHRDIKPSNILLTPDLKIAKIADFGVARIEQTDLTAATSLGEFIGTPRYTSPEQLDGGMIDGRSDLFSFGAVAYEMLTRRKAFDATTMSSLSRS
ncbi:MAG: serine/threonine-protein kinase [Geminicoccaceae bacterium]